MGTTRDFFPRYMWSQLNQDFYDIYFQEFRILSPTQELPDLQTRIPLCAHCSLQFPSSVIQSQPNFPCYLTPTPHPSSPFTSPHSFTSLLLLPLTQMLSLKLIRIDFKELDRLLRLLTGDGVECEGGDVVGFSFADEGVVF
jgi:hypothetical protein